MSKYYGLWDGGSNYAVSYLDESLEVFDSIEQAKYQLRTRYYSGWYAHAKFNRPDGTVDRVATPIVDESSEIQLWASDPRGVRDPYPDMRVYFGPRGGVKVEKL